MLLKETHSNPFVGAFNTNVIVVDGAGKFFLKRHPKDNPQVHDFIAKEQDFLGFTGIGGKFRRRTPQEQERFTISAANQGLRVLPPAFVDAKGVNHYPFLQNAQTLDNFLPRAADNDAQKIVLQLFDDLRLAHSKGFIYGDRWSENMLVLPTYGLMHIDFDLEIYGKAARELEVAQVTFYSLCGGRDKVLTLIANLLGVKPNWFDIRLVEHFAIKLAEQFQHHKTYGNAINDSTRLFDVMRAEYSKKK